MKFALQVFFHNFNFLVYFIYGLVFFLSGFAAWFQARRRSELVIARYLPFLAGFGILHGLAEWGVIFIPIYAAYVGSLTLLAMKVFEVLLVGSSFALLLHFGVSLLCDSTNLNRRLSYVAPVLFGVWLGVVMITLIVNGGQVLPGWFLSMEASARYAFGLPGALVTAFAFWRQISEFDALKLPRVRLTVAIMSLGFASYGVAAGVFVPGAPFVPASVVNAEAFFQVVGIPVQVFRMFFGGLITCCLIRVMDVFELEVSRWLEESARQQAVLTERERISRDLHDGVIQSIYGAGLVLETALHTMDNDPGAASTLVSKAIERLNGTIRQIREYILQLEERESISFTDEMARISRELEEETGIKVNLRIKGGSERQPPALLREELSYVLREAINNAKQHGRAKKVDVLVVYKDRKIEMVVADNGTGFDLHLVRSKGQALRGRGLVNMERRCRRLGGSFQITSAPGQGTVVKASIPYGGV